MMKSRVKRQKTSHAYKILSFTPPPPSPPPPSPPPLPPLFLLPPPPPPPAAAAAAAGNFFETREEKEEEQQKQYHHHHHQYHQYHLYQSQEKIRVAFESCQSVIVGFLCDTVGNKSWRMGLCTTSKFFYGWVQKYCRIDVTSRTCHLAQGAGFSNIYSLRILAEDGGDAARNNIKTIPTSVRYMIVQRLYFLRHFPTNSFPLVEFLLLDFSSLLPSDTLLLRERAVSSVLHDETWPFMEGLKTLVLRNVYSMEGALFSSLLSSSFPNLTHLDIELPNSLILGDDEEDRQIDLTLLTSLEKVKCIHSSKNEQIIKLPTSAPLRKLYCRNIEYFQGYEPARLVVLSCHDSEVLYTQKWTNLQRLRLHKVRFFGTFPPKSYQRYSASLPLHLDAPELASMWLDGVETPEFCMFGSGGGGGSGSDGAATHFPKLERLAVHATRHLKCVNFVSLPLLSLTDVTFDGMDSFLFENTMVGLLRREEREMSAVTIESMTLKHITMTVHSLELLNSMNSLKHLELVKCRLVPTWWKSLERQNSLHGKKKTGSSSSSSSSSFLAADLLLQHSTRKGKRRKTALNADARIILPNLESLTIIHHNKKIQDSFEAYPMPFLVADLHPKLTSVTLVGAFESGSSGWTIETTTTDEDEDAYEKRKEDEKGKESKSGAGEVKEEEEARGARFLKSVLQNAPNLRKVQFGLETHSTKELMQCKQLLLQQRNLDCLEIIGEAKYEWGEKRMWQREEEEQNMFFYNSDAKVVAFN